MREPNAIARLRQEWSGLQEQCPDLTPYQTWEWNDTWWRHYGARKRPCVLLFYAGRGADSPLVGIVPLYVSWHLNMPLRRLAWIGTGQSDYLGPLTLPEYGEAVATAFLDYLQNKLEGWEMADLQQIHADSPLMAHTPCPWPDRPTEGQSIQPMEPCPYLTLPTEWDELTKKLGKKTRSNLGYYERLLQKTFPDAHSFLADKETLEAGMTALFELHQKRWNARWLPGVLGSNRVQTFHREIATRFLEKGWLRLHLIEIEGTIRSVLYCFATGGRTFYYLGGFAPELSKYSLGTLLTAHAIQKAIAEGHTEFDFLRGSEPYKYKWMPEERINQRFLLLRSRRGLGELPGRAGFALTRVEKYVVHRAKAFAEQQGRKEREPKKVTEQP